MFASVDLRITTPGNVWITFSGDRGWTWGKRTPLFSFGVMPNLLQMDNGVLALSFGWPGVQLSFSPDGTGRLWTERREVVPVSCGYTNLVKLSENAFLLAYSDFEYQNEHGETCKAILVRRVTADIRQ